MTEEIIIDGVNVAGCKFYVKHCIEDCYDERVDLYEYCQMFGSECTNEKDCYYKQLKRLKQENEELKKHFVYHKEFMNIVETSNNIDWEKTAKANFKLIEDLKQENENLKKEVKQIGSNFIKKGDYARELENYLACMTEQRNKLKLALEEIRDYINTLSSVDSDFINTETYLRITDKISEVLNESQ